MTLLKTYLLAVLLFASVQWSVSQDDGEGIESTAVASTESPVEMSSTEEMESTEDSEEMTSTDYGSGSGSDSESEDGDSSSAMSSTMDSQSDSDSSSATESSEGDESSSDVTESSESDEDDVDESAEDDNDSEDGDEGEEGGDDGAVLESEEDDQDTDDESTEGPEDVEESTGDGVDVAADDDDECAGLEANECGNTFGDDGMQLCGYNTMTENCYEVVMTAGTRGSGNFDDGYTAAQAVADEQAAQLYTAIGVLGGIMAILVLTVLGGAYYIHSNRKHADYQHTAVPMDIIDVDGGRSMTKGQHTRIESHSVHHSTDSTPMLDTM